MSDSLKTRMQQNVDYFNNDKIELYQPYVISLKSRDILNYVNYPVYSYDNESSFFKKLDFLNKYNEILVDICKKCYLRFNPNMIYSFNDEIHFVFYNTTDYPDLYNGNIHKTLSTITSYITRLFTQKLQHEFDFTFNAKYVSFSTEYEVLNYLVWRQNDCNRNNIIMMYNYFETNLENQKLDDINRKLSECISKLQHPIDMKQLVYGNILKKELIYKEKVNDNDDWINRYIINLNHFNLKEHFKENLVKYIYNKIL
jgi:hypothetical protein